jgi:hypothetical protein
VPDLAGQLGPELGSGPAIQPADVADQAGSIRVEAKGIERVGEWVSHRTGGDELAKEGVDQIRGDDLARVVVPAARR